MSDERDIYSDEQRIADFDYMWEHACSLLFSNDDVYVRPIAKAHRVVRKVVSEWHEEPLIRYLYAPATKVRRRLEVQGYTREKCIELWEREYARHIGHLEKLRGVDDDFNAQIDAQRGLTYEEWEAWQTKQAQLGTFFKWGGMQHFNFTDRFAEFALHLDVHKPQGIWTEYPEYFDPELPLHTNLQRDPVSEYDLDIIEATGTALILTEGHSDTKILSAAIKAMYPEFADMYQFVDFEEFKIEGGASPLTKMVRAFAGVRMSQRIIALFDNDAAGMEQKAVLERMKLPASIRAMVLPNSSIGRRYPTIGPEGLRTMNINGAACSIELFLGKAALTDENGNLRPVRWSSWNKASARYQGELENKNAATTEFLKAMKSGATPAQLRKKFKEMDDLLKAIFSAFG
ncbi:hypothetical protein GOD78_18045 [Sinorhizobium medicae]|uniref:hypothetical protein n=1 Tax=Sinorhizobium medicae TaxID=110321 RepID=UPI000FDB65D9|nr:hypothetical protein [Sinorhizobium medicae]MDX0124499.1 hypothetical protein [Sinorhizobium meliloti]MDX0603884.1 hypothetical protein [Sinorhizobium medicae]MDX0819402.1 hypothetical protein [Sinorhizobium medicae]MDX0863165.1 hypothetical protein [Sinorhizobium medicae]RVJ21217.1 hypothetical protein CN179_27490 [Sinorhizobium medicae]